MNNDSAHTADGQVKCPKCGADYAADALCCPYCGLDNEQVRTLDGQVECSNCGALHAAYDARCPYCGALNPAGAEKAYMDELADLKSDTNQLAHDAERTFATSLQGNAKRIAIIAVVVVAVITAFFLAFNSMDKQAEQQEVKSYQARESFRDRYYAELDRLYEAGDDAALSAYAWSLMDDPGFDALFSWEHVGYLEVYDNWEAVKVAEAEFQDNDGDIDDYTWAVSVAIELANLDANTYRASASLTQAEEARAAAYRADGLAFLENTLQMSEDEVADFAKTALDSEGRVDDAELKRCLEPRLRELGAID